MEVNCLRDTLMPLRNKYRATGIVMKLILLQPNRLLLGLVALLVAGCGGITRPESPRLSDQEAAALLQQGRTLAQQGRPLAAVRLYRQVAGGSPTPRRETLLIDSIELLFDRGYPELAQDYLGELEAQALEGELAIRKRILDGRAALAQRKPRLALERLPIGAPAIPEAQRLALLRTGAQAYAMIGQTVESVRAQIALESLLTDVNQIERNHGEIWNTLEQVSDLTLFALDISSEESVLGGWIELAGAIRNARLEQGSLTEAIEDWQRDHGGHPAAGQFAQELLAKLRRQTQYPQQIGLLLPLSGRYAEIATAVRDGFFAQYYQSSVSADKPEIRIYDVGDDPALIWDYYRKAVSEGAKLIVGPLDKAAVTRMATSDVLPVPVLSLNYVDDPDHPLPTDFTQYGLLPEDEAEQVAALALSQGLLNAVALVPDSSWGERALKAFRKRYREQQGVLLDAATYAAEDNDFSAPIVKLLHLRESRWREQSLRQTLGVPLKFEPRRREDLDLIFVAAFPKQARLIKPQFRFHRAGDIPVYATSHAYSGAPDPLADKDMNGLVYCDIPWLLANKSEPRPAYDAIQRLWPDQLQRYGRLFALGLDAYGVIPYLHRMRANPNIYYEGYTGNLSIDERNRMHRQLVWGRFKKGIPERQPFEIPSLKQEHSLSPSLPQINGQRADLPAVRVQ
jgi:outer membrane PBP1 activator LpoA protein